MTDPDCHEARASLNAFVTGAQQGESSSATNSSGVSCYDSDDDESLDSGDDDDDEKEIISDDSLSSRSHKWATADGYNLTTFDQTECSTWAINQPLPLPVWAKNSKPILAIDKV